LIASLTSGRSPAPSTWSTKTAVPVAPGWRGPPG
jgi:hypothetical protein